MSHRQLQVLFFCWLYRVSPSGSVKNITNLILVLTTWWCPHIVISWVVGKWYLLWPVHSLKKTLISLCPASLFCTLRPNLPVILGLSWLPTFAFKSPMMKRHLFLVLVLESLVILHRSSQLQLLLHEGLAHWLGLLWCWMVCFGNELRSFYHFWDCTEVLHIGLYEGYCISSKWVLPTEVDAMVIWIKFAHSYPFQSLIPKMLMFNLAISCLTTYNLPWFMDLTFQVPMQYCSLQHQTLLSPPDTSTTEHHFCFGPDISFFLELLVIALCSSSVAYWTPSDTEGSPSGVVSVCLFILLTGFSWQKILEWVATSSCSGPHFILTLHYDPFILGGPAWQGSWLHWVMKALSPQEACDPWRGNDQLLDFIFSLYSTASNITDLSALQFTPHGFPHTSLVIL